MSADGERVQPVTEAATQDAEPVRSPETSPSPKRRGNTANLRPPWKPGQTGNPGGYPKKYSELKALAHDCYPAAVRRLAELMDSRDEEMAFKAVSLCLVYVLGKPQEGRELAMAENLRARLTELVAVPTSAPPLLEQAPPLPAVALASETQVMAAPSLTTPGTSDNAPAEPPPVAVGTPPVADVPTGLRCLYSSQGSRCEAEAEGGSQWCAPHKAKLFAALGGV